MPSKTFRIEGTFQAADIDDALKRLAEHFAAESLGYASPMRGEHEFVVEAVSDDSTN